MFYWCLSFTLEVYPSGKMLVSKSKKIDNMTTYPNYNHPFECCSLRCPQCTIQYQNQNMTCAKQPSICLRLPLSLAVSLVHVPNFLLLKILTYQDLPVLPLPIFWFFLCLILSLFPCRLICSYCLNQNVFLRGRITFWFLRPSSNYQANDHCASLNPFFCVAYTP